MADLAVVLLVVLLSESARGVVLPSLARGLLGQGCDEGTVSAAIACFSLGRLAATMPLAYVGARRGTRHVVMAAAGVSVAGHLLYAMFVGVPGRQVTIVLSRLIIGIGTGSFGACRGYIASRTSVAERTRLVALSGMFQFAGFAIAPGFALMFPDLESPGVVMLLLNVLVIMGALVYMPLSDPVAPSVDDTSFTSKTEAMEGTTFCVFMFLNVVLRGILADGETLIPVQHAAVFEVLDDDSEIEDCANFFFVLGIFGSICFLAIDPVIRRSGLSELAVFIFGILMVALGGIFLIDPVHGKSTKLFTVGAALIWCLGSPITQTFTISLYSKLLGTKPQTIALGWLTTAGSIGRIVFPIGALRLTSIELWTTNAALCILCIVLLFILYCKVPTERSPKPLLVGAFETTPLLR